MVFFSMVKPTGELKIEMFFVGEAFCGIPLTELRERRSKKRFYRLHFFPIPKVFVYSALEFRYIVHEHYKFLFIVVKL